MVRVLYVTDSLKQRYGVTSVIMNYMSHFDFSKIQVDLLAFSDSEEAVIDRAKSFGAEVFFMPRLSLTNIIEFKSFINKFFIYNKYDIVHSHFNQIDSIVFPIARKNGVMKCISHSHSTKLSTNRIKAIRNRIMCFNIYDNADVCAACSIVAGEVLFGKRYKDSNKKYLVNNAIECAKFAYKPDVRQRVRNYFGFNNEVVIGHVGSLKTEKNHKFLINFFAKLIDSSPQSDFKLMIVGDGELRGKLENQVKELGIEKKVIFTGLRKDVNELLQAMDIFVLPSLFEGLPVIGIEAQTSGLPCFLSSVITKEVDIQNVKFLDLNEQLWIDAVLECSRANITKRVSNEVLIRNRGYDINVEAKALIEFYESLAIGVK